MVNSSSWLGAAVAALLVSGGAAATARATRDDRAASLTVVATGQAAPSTPTTTPAATPVPTPVATPQPARTVEPTAAPPLPVARPVPSPTAAAPAPPVQTGRWRHTERGVTVELSISPALPRAGQLVTWTVRTHSTGARCCDAELMYGDGQGTDRDHCLTDAPKKATTSAVRVAEHAYRRGGTFTAWINVMAGCDGPRFFTFKPAVVVADGPLLSNGPAVPTAHVDDSVAHSRADPAAGQYFVAEVYDHDGAPMSWWWDFGDGTRTPATANPHGCRWPRDGGWAEAESVAHVAHRYAKAGSYTVRFTATTAGCDGKDAQTVSVTMLWTVD